jgi:hypothetical protein
MGRCIKRVAFEEVLACFDKEHEVKPDNTNGHARSMLQAAHEKFDGSWAFISLDREEILSIFLPHHISEGGAIPLIPPTGLTVVDAVEKIRKISIRDYQSANAVCWRKIAHWKENYPSPVFLCIAPVSHSDYQYLVNYQGHLIHLDGLHRLIAWGLSGKFEPGEYEKREKVTAYVAGLKEDGYPDENSRLLPRTS